MPIINYSTVAGVLTETQKSDLCTALTNAVAETLGETLRPHVWITLNEHPEGSFFIGGQALKAKALKSLISTNDAH